jgi:hypothetical protein
MPARRGGTSVYFWPHQIDDCKINELGIRDQGILEQIERFAIG